MTEELGRIERPEAERFKGERKLYLVPLLFAGKDSPPDYVEKFELYWQQVGEQIANQEQKIGRVKRVYHESITLAGEEGLTFMEKLSPHTHRITEEKCRDGAVLEPIELTELVSECMDWERCLMLGFLSQSAAEKVAESYREASKKRFEHISRRIDETLGEDEVAILFIREGHAVQFAEDVRVFSVAPPALDAIYRWLRDRSSRQEEPSDPE